MMLFIFYTSGYLLLHLVINAFSPNFAPNHQVGEGNDLNCRTATPSHHDPRTATPTHHDPVDDKTALVVSDCWVFLVLDSGNCRFLVIAFSLADSCTDIAKLSSIQEVYFYTLGLVTFVVCLWMHKLEFEWWLDLMPWTVVLVWS